MKTYKQLIFLIILIVLPQLLQAEGTKQWSISATDHTFLKVNTTGNYAFAGYGLAADKRLHIHVDDHVNETVYIGLSRMVDENSAADLATAYSFRIRSPGGTIVHGPFSVTSPNLTSYAMAAAGPDTVAAGGYPVGGIWTFDPTESGDYYIEFSTAASIRWFDITVAEGGTAIDGRVWSQAWAVRANNGFGDGGFFDTPFNGRFIAYDGQYATQIDFNNSGLRPLEGQFSFNQTGPGSTGNIENDRRSVNGVNSTNPFHKIFLNQPDPTIYPLSPEGVLTNQPITIANPAMAQLPLEVSQPGELEIVMNFGPGNERRLFADAVAGVNLVPWDGKDGNGVTIGIEDYPITVSVSYTQGVTHFTAYDVEGLDNGFEVRTQTASGTIGPNLQRWDDTNIADNPGTADAQVNVDTGAATRRRWNQNDYGDLNTINTWWYAYQGFNTTTLTAPGDYGDAPNSYGEAFHVDPDNTTVYLGTVPPDEDTDTLNTASGGTDGEGDDTDGTDDEDGISIFPPITTATSTYTLPAANITVDNSSGANATLYGFIDFNNNGNFNDPGESVSVNVSPGASQPDTDLVFNGFTISPSAGTTYARFRITTQTGVGPDWVAADGEVEDYALPISIFVPVTPPTPTGNPGTCWAIDDNTATLYKFSPDVASPQPPVLIPISRSNDGEGLAWRPSTNELFMWDGSTTYVLNANTGADVRSFTASLSPGNSVEGATFYVNPVTLQEELWLTVEDYVSGSRRNDRYLIRIDPDTGASISSAGPMAGGYIDPGVDYGKDTGGLAIDPNSKQFWVTNDGLARGLYPMDSSTAAVGSGTLFNPSEVDAEGLAFANDGYLYTESDEGPSNDRYIWRIDDVSTGAITRAAGPFPGSGDVEGLTCDGGASLFVDHSDAPLTSTSYGDAEHSIVDGIQLGTAVTAETAGYDSANADGDADDGVNLPAVTQAATTTITATVAGTGGYLQGWIDWNGNGTFEVSEQVAANLQDDGTGDDTTAADGIITFNVTAPGLATLNQTFARFRWSTTSGLDSTTAASDGEVEDYALTINSGWPVPPVTGPGDGGECVLTHHTNPGVAADDNSFYTLTDHTNPSTLLKIGPWDVASGTVEGLTADVANGVFYALNADRSGTLVLGQLGFATGSFADITTAGPTNLSHSVYGALSVFQSRAIAHQPGTNEVWVAAYSGNPTQPPSSPGSSYGYLFKMDTTTGNVITGAFAGEDYIAIDMGPHDLDATGSRSTIEALTFYGGEPNILYGVVSTDRSAGSPKTGHLFAVDITQTTPQAVLAPNNLSGVSYLPGDPAPTSAYFDIEGMSFDANGDLVIVSANAGGPNASSIFTVDLATGIAGSQRSIISGDWEGIVCAIGYPKDYGDAPTNGTAPDNSNTNNYGTPSHQITQSIYLGNVPADQDTAHQSSPNADGDDNDTAGDDEEGVTFPNLTIGSTKTITVSVTGAGGYLQGWIDWNGDGDFNDTVDGTSEQIIVNAQDNTTTVAGRTDDSDTIVGQISIAVSVPPSAITTAPTFARFRWSTTLDLNSDSAAENGEVEDYAHTVLAGQTLEGIVFEDIDYGGGAGRDQTTSSGVGVNGATVEIYDSTGTFVATTTTANDGTNDGAYAFEAIVDGDYYIRVVNDTVSSTRAGQNGSELGIQTFRTDGTTAVTGEIGGRNPAIAGGDAHDPGNPSVLNTTNFTFNGGTLNGAQAQSIQPITVAGIDRDGIDFGYNFDTIVNTNNAGQGSLRQFILNSNQLTDIPNQGISAGKESSIFMIPDGSGYAGTANHGTLDLSTAGLFTLAPTAELPAITDTQTAVDGSTQNSAQCDPAAAGGRVLNIALDGSGLSGAESGLTVQNSGYLMQGLAIGNFPEQGIYAHANADDGVIVCNHIGLNAAGTTATPNSDNGILINNTNNTQIGNGSPTGRNVISGNNSNGSVLGDTGHGVRVENNANNATFLDNYIGLDASGTNAIPNAADGINVNNATNIVVGNDTVAGRNVISGNTGQGIYALGNTVTIDIAGNYVGTDNSGLNAVGNNHGIYLNQTAGSHSIRNNVTSGQRGYGIILYYSPNNTVTGNIAGLDKDGLNVLGNARSGLWIAKTGATSSTGNQIGGTTPAERNIFSGNGDYGVLVEDVPAGNTITGNYMGTDITGNTAAPNTLGGILIQDAPDTIVGGVGAGEGNVISGNTGIGLGIARAAATNSQVFGNLIGRNAGNTAALGNGGSGINVYDNAPDNTIGGRGAGEGNIIAHNGRNGVEVTAPGAITIVGNTMYANGQLGIDLDNDNVSLNDSNDADSGANDLLNFPQFNQISIVGTNLLVSGCAPAGATLDLFEADVSPTSASGEPAGANQMGKLQDYGEGERLLVTLVEGVGEDAVATPVDCTTFVDIDGNNANGMNPFRWTLPLPPGLINDDKVTATSTLAGVGTSEFSGIIEVTSLDYGDAPGYADAANAVDGATYMGNAPDIDTGTIATNGDATDDNFDDGVRRNGTTLQDQVLNNDSPTTLTVTTSGSGRLHGWIDWDSDGVFGNNANELIISEAANGSGTRTFSVSPPNNLTPGFSFARFRYSPDAAAGNPSGIASNGEVEDYRVMLSRGFSISGRVFNDSNVDGINDAAEAGITELPVVLYDTVNGTCISSRTNANGDYSFDDVVPGDYQVYEASRESVPVPQNCGPANAKDPGGYLSTTDNVSATLTVSNASISDIDFGDVKPPVFELDNTQTVLPNTTALHPHVFTALSEGSVSFSIAAETADPTSLIWGTQLLVDTNCDGQLDSGDTAMPASINVTAGQQICVLTKVLSPANASAGAVQTLDIQSDFTFGNGSSSLSNDVQTRQDITHSSAGTTTEPPVDPVVDPVGTPDSVGGEGKLSLVKSVWNVTRNIDGGVALPGETLLYTIHYTNIGNGPLNELIITDSVPEFTELVPASMLCTDKPAELPLCAANDSLNGDLSWSWAAEDKLFAGSKGSVSYEVIIE